MWGLTVRGGRATAYLLINLVTGLAAMMAVPMLGVTAIMIVVAGIGLILFPLALDGVRRWAEWERRRACARLGIETPSRYALLPGVPLKGGVFARLKQVVTGRDTWRAVLWLVLQTAIGTATGLLGFVALLGAPLTLFSALTWTEIPGGTSILGMTVTSWPMAFATGGVQIVIAIALFWWAAPAVSKGHARLAHVVLSPSAAELRAAELAERVEVLSESRAGAVDAHGAELRRIERDLHDGTQARLVSIAMRLGVAEQAAKDDPEAVATLIKDARGGAEEAMQELRDVVRTMYPPILADRGLDGALAALGARCPVPTQVDASNLVDVPAPVEAAAYFVVAESLTNVAKHSGAHFADVKVTRSIEDLLVEVEDDGVGGIDEQLGTGISGIRRRVEALDGMVQVDSPSGGPTKITVQLPCGS